MVLDVSEWRRSVQIQAQLTTRVSLLVRVIYFQLICIRFVLKTKEQRAAEKALFDKSPLNTLTLEDFLESERHKLTGTLTPVTPETFAKWKKGRMDKKEAEQALQKAKEDTGRAMFEKGGWEDSEDEDGEEADLGWNLQQLRLETEKARQKKEEDRLAGGGFVGESVVNDDDDFDGTEADEATLVDDGGEGSSRQESDS